LIDAKVSEKRKKGAHDKWGNLLQLFKVFYPLALQVMISEINISGKNFV